MNPVAAMSIMAGGVALALAGREVARSAAEDEIVWRALVGLGMMVLGAVGVFLAINIMAAVGG